MIEPGRALLLTQGNGEWLVDTGSQAKTTRRAHYPRGALVVGRSHSRGLPHGRGEWKFEREGNSTPLNIFSGCCDRWKGSTPRCWNTTYKVTPLTPGVRPSFSGPFWPLPLFMPSEPTLEESVFQPSPFREEPDLEMPSSWR